VSGLKHPARHYIYYLLSKRIHSAHGVIKELESLGLPAPIKETEELNHFVAGVLRIKREMKFPDGFNPAERTPTPDTLDFVKTWKIRDAWQSCPFLGQAATVLQAPQLRFALELMLLGPLSVLGIANRLKARYDLPDHAMNAGVVRAFRHYFWDVNAMSPVQWKSFLELHYKEEYAEYIASLSAPRSMAGAAYVLSIADKDPQLLAPEARYEIVASMSFKSFMTIACNPTGNSAFSMFAALNAMLCGICPQEL
jgi:hypothetical protein